MAEITERLGFDASQAISTLNELNTSLKAVNRSLGTFNKRASTNTQQATDNLNNLGASAQRAKTAITQTGNQFQRSGKQSAAAIQEVTFGINGLLKALTARFAVQALTNLIGALGEATDAAQEFGFSVARISNIADGQAGSIDNLTESLLDLSVSLGRDIAEVSEAAFEGLQNDLGTTEETLRFLETAAADLALVTGGTLPQAVNSVSSVIKSFGVDIAESNRIADIFFGAIDAGRITLGEFQSSLGRVAPLAGELNLTFTETAASIAAITQQGTSASVAQTQLRNVLQKLIDPTEELKGAFEALGVATGQELIEATGGLIPALQALEREAGGNAERFSDFFGTIRGQLGALNILSNDAQIATNIFEELSVNAGRAAEAAGRIRGTEAQRAAEATEELNRTFLELGQTLLPLRTTFIETLNAVIDGGEQAIAVISGLAAGASVAAAAAFGLGTAFTAALGPIALVAAAVAGAVLTFNTLTREADQSLDSFLQNAQSAITEFRDANRRAAEDFINENNRLIEAGTQANLDAVQEFTSGVSAEFAQLVAISEATQADIRSNVEQAARGFSQGITGVLKDVRNQIDDLTDGIDTFRDRAQQAAQDARDLSFEQGLERLTQQQRVQERLNRLTQEEARLRELAADVSQDEASQRRIIEQEARVREAAREAEAEAERSSNRFNIRQARDERLEALRVIEQANETAASNLSSLQEQLDGERLNKLEAGLKRLADIAKDLGVAEPDSDAADRLGEQFSEAVRNLDASVLEELGLAETLEGEIESFANTINNATFEWRGAAQSLQTALDSETFRAAVELQISDTGNVQLDRQLQDIAEQTLDPGASLNQQIQAIGEFEQAQSEVSRTFQENTNNARNANEAFNTSLDNVNQRASTFAATIDFMTGGLAGFVESAENARNVSTTLGEIQTDILNAGAEDRAAIEERLATANETINTLKNGGDLSAEQTQQLVNATTALQALLDALQARQADARLIDADALQEANIQIDAAKTGVERLKIEAVGTEQATRGTAEAAQRLPEPLARSAMSASQLSPAMYATVQSTNAATQSANQLADAYRRAAIAASSIPSRGGDSLYHGGKTIYRQGGGPITRGQDTQLTATSPGEFIVNSRSSRQFFSQLQAMNAGQTPQFRDQGGSVTNVGDINLNMYGESGNQSPTTTGRKIASVLRRELRRQTSNL